MNINQASPLFGCCLRPCSPILWQLRPSSWLLRFSWNWTSGVEYDVPFHFIHCLPKPLGLTTSCDIHPKSFSSCTISVALKSTVAPLELGLATLITVLFPPPQVFAYSNTQCVVFGHGDYGHGCINSDVFHNLMPFSSVSHANLSTHLLNHYCAKPQYLSHSN